MTFRLFTTLLTLAFAILFAVNAKAQQVTLSVSGIKSAKGALLVSVFKDQEGFKNDKPVSKHKFPKTGFSGGTMKVSLNLSPGTYGIALMDDENGNHKMDNNMIGMPKEGFGFSNFYLSGLSRPVFNDFKFEVKPGATNLTSKLRYL